MASKTSKGQEGYYASYKSGNKHAKNRKTKLERQLKLQPNNEQVANALKDIHYRRGTPKTQMWGHSQKRMAQVFKEFCGHFDYNIFNSNPKVAAEALQTLDTVNRDFKLPASIANSPAAKLPYSLMARATCNGQLVWTAWVF